MISSLELAKICGVSQGTVDRALHNRPGIASKTRLHILRMAEKHGYQANPSAVEIMQGKSVIVGGLVPQFNSVFFMDLFQTIAQKLETIGLRLHIGSYATNESFVPMLTDFAARKSAGVIMVPPPGVCPAIPEPVIRSTPVISLLSTMTQAGIHAAHPDEIITGRDATLGLIQRGHRHIAMMDFSNDSYAITARYQGYADAMQNAGLTPMRLRKPDNDSLRQAIHDRRITALFCHNDWLALEAVRQLNSIGYRVPDDVSVLGVDDSPTFTTLCDQITTMRYPRDDIAAHTAAILRGRPIQQRVKPCVWVSRRSVASIGSPTE